MSAATSPSTRRRYGLARVCTAWCVPRSSHYVERERRRASSSAPTGVEIAREAIEVPLDDDA